MTGPFGPGSERLPGEPTRLRQGDHVVLEALGLEFTVLDIPGHTAGHAGLLDSPETPVARLAALAPSNGHTPLPPATS